MCENEKRKRCNRIPSDITLGRKLRYCRIRVPGEFGTIFITLSRLKGRMFKLNNICMALFMKIVCFQIYKTICLFLYLYPQKLLAKSTCAAFLYDVFSRLIKKCKMLFCRHLVFSGYLMLF